MGDNRRKLVYAMVRRKARRLMLVARHCGRTLFSTPSFQLERKLDRCWLSPRLPLGARYEFRTR
jgi:hypothetical protein